MAAGKLTLLQRLRKTKIYRGKQMNNALPKRLNWEQIEARPRQEGQNVVKGTSKRIVVVKSPDPRVFEQAIFIVREDFLHRRGAEPKHVLREAQEVADEYVRAAVAAPRSFLSRIPPFVFAIVGALLVAGAWLALHFAGI